MPYWIYDVKQQNEFHLHGTKSRRSGDYIITLHYSLSGEIDASYHNVSHDGSSSFADNISSKIAPYRVSNMKKFTPAFLSGFYADAADVGVSVYEADVIETAETRTIQYIKEYDGVKEFTIKNDEDELKQKLGTTITKEQSAMFPVWFLSYRNKDRVAYATVNGQTGKVVADLPVDIKKYLFGTIIVSIPIYFLLNMFLTVTPSVLLTIVIILSMIVAIMYASELKQIIIREGYAQMIKVF